MDVWVERLRKWIGHSIMQRLVQTIADINSSLVKVGLEDMEIGEVG